MVLEMTLELSAPEGVERTLNGTGFMISSLDEISQAFVEHAAQDITKPVLDIGAAFGVATHAALEAGASVVANDIEPRHLEILDERTPDELRSQLTIASAAFPNDLDFPPFSFSGILLSRVMHFFSGDEMDRSILSLFNWLIPGGKVFVVVEASLFLNKPPLREQYELQLEAGARWPGFVGNVRELLPKRASFVPDKLHYLSPDILTRAFTEGGFTVETAHRFHRDEMQGEDENEPRESIGLIATKL